MNNKLVSKYVNELVLSKSSIDHYLMPPLYKVFMLYSELIPIDFFTDILYQVFYLDNDKIQGVLTEMVDAGRGNCGIYSKDVAETKSMLAQDYAKNNDYELICVIEKI